MQSQDHSSGEASAPDGGGRPLHVKVCGNDHSPWVQAVLLGLHEAGIPAKMIAAPPFHVFRQSGVLMPVVQLDDGPWIYDSGRILAAIGYGPVGEELAKLLGRCFLHTAMTRVDDGWAFWSRFSYVRDDARSPGLRSWHHLFRAVAVFYFFVLISLGRRRIPAADAETIAGDLRALQGYLTEAAPYLGGGAPDTADYQLFGLIQMFESIPGTPLDVFCHHPGLEELRRWASRMQARLGDYPRLYTAQRFEPRSPSRPVASPFERALFWTGAAACWIAAPVTIPMVAFFAARVRRKGLVGA